MSTRDQLGGPWERLARPKRLGREERKVGEKEAQLAELIVEAKVLSLAKGRMGRRGKETEGIEAMDGKMKVSATRMEVQRSIRACAVPAVAMIHHLPIGGPRVDDRTVLRRMAARKAWPPGLVPLSRAESGKPLQQDWISMHVRELVVLKSTAFGIWAFRICIGLKQLKPKSVCVRVECVVAWRAGT